MNSRREPAPSATSLDVSPEDDSRARTRNYLITMAIRTACLILLVVIRPYGWHTVVLAIGAVFLPYIAVVMANARATRRVTGATAPESVAIASERPAGEPDEPAVFRISESRADGEPEPSAATEDDAPADGDERDDPA